MAAGKKADGRGEGRSMAIFGDVETPISADAPCGPDPELNPNVQNFLAVAEGQLPATYREFDKKSFEAVGTLEKIAEHFAVSRDIRMPILAAKYQILSDDIAAFVSSIITARSLLTSQWEHCHPTEEAGGAALRAAYLQSLDDMPTSVLPLQNATLIADRRLGQITMRSILVADKKLPARTEEQALDADLIRDAFRRVEPVDRLLAIRDQLSKIPQELDAIRTLFVDKVGYDIAPQFTQLPDLARSITAYLGDIIKEMNPVAADATAEAETDGTADLTETSAPRADGAAVQTADIASFRQATKALEAVLGYYAAFEPSSPARLLVKQGHQLIGKSFVEAMRILAPGMVDETRIKMGGDAPFTLDFNQLSALVEDESASDHSEGDDIDFSAASRAEATALMRKVEQFYKVKEPSSPIPLLLERARNFVAKDFTSLLKDMVRKDETA
jgi:type VI secretion system protein ImpA